MPYTYKTMTQNFLNKNVGLNIQEKMSYVNSINNNVKDLIPMRKETTR